LYSDEDLALGIQQGQTDALITLVERHYQGLLGYLYRLTNGNRPLSEDMAQETFLRALRGIGGYAYPRAFKPWLYAIATNLTRNYFSRADTRYTSTVEDEVLGSIAAQRPSPEESLEDDDEVRELLEALRVLPDEQREIILLRYYEELSLADIAETLDIPLGTVKSRLRLALNRMRVTMEQES